MVTPTERVLRWAADEVGAKVVGVRGLRDGAGPWLVRFDGAEAVLRTGDRDRLASEAAALTEAERHGLAAPRLIASRLDSEVAALLSTVLPGRSRIPVVATTARLHALGAAVAAFLAVPLEPVAGLPVRRRSLADVHFARTRRSSLLVGAEAHLLRVPEPPGPRVLVHGDLWQGNTMWLDDTFVGMIDWDSAGVGHYGIDLGSVRCDAAIMFGPEAAEQVLAGWRQGSGLAADDIAYWDVVAALGTPDDLADWLPVIHGQGRTDLDASTINHRRDSFLRGALGAEFRS